MKPYSLFLLTYRTGIKLDMPACFGVPYGTHSTPREAFADLTPGSLNGLKHLACQLQRKPKKKTN